MAYPVEFIALDSIRTDLATAARSQLDEPTVARYLDAAPLGAELPPVTVYRGDDGVNWLSDGRHRCVARSRAGFSDVACEVRPGGYDAAVLAAAASNNAHGLQRSDADKAGQVRMLLSHPTYGGWSTRQIAEQARVSQAFASKVRDEFEAATGKTPAKRLAKDGREMPAKMKTAGRDSDEPLTLAVVDADPDIADDEAARLAADFDAPAKVPTDRFGTPVPKNLLRLFESSDEIKAKGQELGDFIKWLENSRGDKAFLKISINNLKAKALDIKTTLADARPSVVCPACGGQGCETCESVGAVCMPRYDGLDQELKQTAERFKRAD